MIWHPQYPDSVTIRYGSPKGAKRPGDGENGLVIAATKRPGPITAEVMLFDGRILTVPRRYLFRRR